MTSAPEARGALHAVRPERAGEPAELYRLLVASVRDYAIFALDARGHVLTWNAGAANLKGYQAHEIIGRHFSTFYPPEDIAAGKPETELVVAARDGRFEDEGWRLRRDGSRFWANVIVTALRDESGEVVGFAKVTRDLTERRAAEEQAIRLAAESAARTTAELRSHELDTLNQTLQEQAIELEAQTEEAQALAEQLEETNRELEQALEAARTAHAAADRASRAKSDFLAVMSHELRTPLNAIGGHTQILEMGLHGPITDGQREALERIGRAQRHLLGNAAKFTPPRGEVEMRLVDGQNPDMAVIEVRDSGPGIPPDKLELIFEPFVQLERSLTTPSEGAGLGLAISRDLARGMRGDLWAQSDAGQGATLVLTLPRAVRTG